MTPTEEESRYYKRLQVIEKILDENSDPSLAIVKILKLDAHYVNRLDCDHGAEGRESYMKYLNSIIDKYAKEHGIDVTKIKEIHGL